MPDSTFDQMKRIDKAIADLERATTYDNPFCGECYRRDEIILGHLRDIRRLTVRVALLEEAIANSGMESFL